MYVVVIRILPRPILMTSKPGSKMMKSIASTVTRRAMMLVSHSTVVN